MKKFLQKLLVSTMELSTYSSNLDDGTQFKIVDRLMARCETFQTEEKALENLLECLVDEIQAARRECKDEDDK